MRRYRALLLSLLVLVAVGGGLAGFYWALVQVPEFYGTALEKEPEPAVRQEAAQTFVRRTMQLADGIQHADEWSEEFTETQINSWLSEELQPKYGKIVPQGVSEPRVQLAGESIGVAFRYQQENWSGVVSVRVRPWVPQPNQLAFEIQSIRAGLVPIPLEHILHELSDHLTTEGWRIEWSELNGNDVVILHLAQPKAHQPVLEAVQVVDGSIRVAGRRGLFPSSSEVAPKRMSASRESATE